MDKNNTNANIMLLDDAYKNTRMGSYAIENIIAKIADTNLQDLLQKQYDCYLDFTNKLEDYAKTISYKPKDLNAMLKTSSFVSINMKTLFDKDTSHIAEMLIQGTTMGITTLISELKEHPSAQPELINISKDIISSQEKFVESLKEFL